MITLNKDELYVDFPRKKPTKTGKTYNRYYISLNPYRNWNAFVEGKIKKQFQSLLLEKFEESLKLGCISSFEPTSKIKITYTIYNGTKARFDVSNQLCIIDKYFCDMLVVNGYLEDDSYDYITEVLYKYGYKTKEKKVEIEIDFP
mgnify:CR=1 FL=1